MAYAKERILKQMMPPLNKVMSAAELSKQLRQGKGAIKNALGELRREGLIEVRKTIRNPLGGPGTGYYAWSGKDPAELPKSAITQEMRINRIIAALEREPMLSSSELAVEIGTSITPTRRIVHGLHATFKIRIAGWRLGTGTPTVLYGLANGEPDVPYVAPAKVSKAVRKPQVKVEEERKPTIIKPRRDPAASWF